MDQSDVKNASTYEPRHSLHDRLDDHYLFLLQFIDGSVKGLEPEHKDLAKKWLVKLGSMLGTESFALKMKRNRYMNLLMVNICDKALKPPFNQSPPNGDLPEMEPRSDHSERVIRSPEWLDQLLTVAQYGYNVGGKNFETYLSTKMFENGRGAAAYLAVSVQNMGDKSAWVKLQPNEQKQSDINEMFDKEQQRAAF